MTASSTRRLVYKYADALLRIIQELDRFGIRFLKDENGDFDVKKVHHIGTYVLPDAERRHRQEGALPPAAAGPDPDFQPLHGDAAADRGGRPHRRRHRGQHPYRGVFSSLRAKAVILCVGRGRAARPAGVRLSVRHLRERRPIPATATRWPITPAPRSRTSNASRSIR